MATDTESGTGKIRRGIGVPQQDAPVQAWSPPSADTLPPVPRSAPKASTPKSTPKPAPLPPEARLHPPGSNMVLIEAGEFIMGDDDGARDEQPQNRVLLNAYWIDRYPVTNRDYKAFVDATDHRAPPHWKSGNHTSARDLHSVTNTNWEDAIAYARWSGKRLPTEAEWEKAARGTLGQNYPWGDAFRKDNVNSSNDYEGTTPVNQFPGGASPYGVMDMCGNVQEWCTDWYYDDMYTTSAL
ncbi:MAG: SUMF1/EgtB/PvdO family nonheme iron enzyme, partial [bacterium]|nr:SUMF1/EgtB/PvdO family nonheme iron enzyme [bacterium]